MIQFGVKTEIDKNVKAISSFFLNWRILENWGQKYGTVWPCGLNLVKIKINWMFGVTVKFESLIAKKNETGNRLLCDL